MWHSARVQLPVQTHPSQCNQNSLAALRWHPQSIPVLIWQLALAWRSVVCMLGSVLMTNGLADPGVQMVWLEMPLGYLCRLGKENYSLIGKYMFYMKFRHDWFKVCMVKILQNTSNTVSWLVMMSCSLSSTSLALACGYILYSHNYSIYCQHPVGQLACQLSISYEAVCVLSWAHTSTTGLRGLLQLPQTNKRSHLWTI